VAFKYFNVKNGLVTGNILLHASNSSISANSFTGNLSVTDTANLGNISNVKITGGTANYVLQTDGQGNLSWAAQTGGGSSNPVYFESNVSEVIAGSALVVNVSYANSTYPGGLFTLEQLGPVTFAALDSWQTTNTASKNAYANFIANTANVSNIKLTLSLSNATFDVQSTDTITVGSSVITGENLTSIGISGAGGNYVISSQLVGANVQTNSSSVVSANLTTTRGVRTTNGTTLTTIAPVPFNVTSLTGSFTSSSVPYWATTQTFNWAAALTTGATVASGNVNYDNAANSVSGGLTTIGAVSGTSPSLDSRMAYVISSTDYTGAGGFGAGTRTIPSTVNGTVNAASVYYPLFYKTTGSSANPVFTIEDTRNSNNYATGQGANTTAITTNYLWIGTPTSTPRAFAFTFLGSRVDIEPDVTYADQSISGQTYMVYGFNDFSAITFIYTV
jgi:hypothetical protein